MGERFDCFLSATKQKKEGRGVGWGLWLGIGTVGGGGGGGGGGLNALLGDCSLALSCVIRQACDQEI